MCVVVRKVRNERLLRQSSKSKQNSMSVQNWYKIPDVKEKNMSVFCMIYLTSLFMAGGPDMVLLTDFFSCEVVM